jgi:CheY-like chemotaxis protein
VQASPLAGVRVLVVDDTPDSLDVTALVLELNGATVLTASSAAEAFDLLESVTIDVLITDLGMPGEDGYGLLHSIRREHPDQNGFVPAIALTGFSSDEEYARTRTAGFRAHLVKPVEPEKLVSVVAELAAGH